ncbi:MAG: hypothetical protein APR55_11410 [Methanolinea sp. SDB]|nr:MAG: hypothetical protein APR55_11410 [Methanolinea sp. SDB]
MHIEILGTRGEIEESAPGHRLHSGLLSTWARDGSNLYKMPEKTKTQNTKKGPHTFPCLLQKRRRLNMQRTV